MVNKIYKETVTAKILVFLLNNKNKNKNRKSRISKELKITYGSTNKIINRLFENGILHKSKLIKTCELTKIGREFAEMFNNINKFMDRLNETNK